MAEQRAQQRQGGVDYSIAVRTAIANLAYAAIASFLFLAVFSGLANLSFTLISNVFICLNLVFSAGLALVLMSNSVRAFQFGRFGQAGIFLFSVLATFLGTIAALAGHTLYERVYIDMTSVEGRYIVGEYREALAQFLVASGPTGESVIKMVQGIQVTELIGAVLAPILLNLFLIPFRTRGAR